ncbi:MAG TPA: hypothetical protein VGC79_00870, partial [Polyangiaceae bacterium]
MAAQRNAAPTTERLGKCVATSPAQFAARGGSPRKCSCRGALGEPEADNQRRKGLARSVLSQPAEAIMLYTLVVVLLVLWALGL